MFCKLLKADPFLSLFPPPTPILSGKVKTVMPAPASPTICWRDTHLPAYVFYTSLPCASSLYSPTLNSIDVNPRNTSPFSVAWWTVAFQALWLACGLVPSVAKLLSSVRVTANTWGYPYAWFCLLCISMYPVPVALTVRNTRYFSL